MGIRVPEVNNIVLAGRLVRDAVRAATPQGTPVLEFTLAVSRRVKVKDSEPREEVSYLDCAVYGNLALALHGKLVRGRPVHVDGRVKQEEQNKRSRVYVVANRVQCLDWEAELEEKPRAATQRPAQPAVPRQSEF